MATRTGKQRFSKALRVLPALAIGLTLVCATSGMNADDRSARPTVPNANRNDGSRFFLEKANRLDARQGLPYQILSGDVEFRKQGMFMYCDSAHFNDTEGMIEAFGNVRMEQGDTLFVYADRLVYTDTNRLAILYSDYGQDVRLINRDVELQTIEFNYDLEYDLGYYEFGGTLIDKNNRLTSHYGEYSPSTKEANFAGNVHLVSNDDDGSRLDIRSERLQYNTTTSVAEINSPAVITSRDGVIHTDSAFYNTTADTTLLFNRSLVIANNGNTLTADTLFYDRLTGYGIGHGNVEINDTTNHVMLNGEYGYYNELSDSAIVTGRALAREFGRPDTLYLHGDTIRSLRILIPELRDETNKDSIISVADTTHHLIASPHVRFWRVDLQGLCDTMTFVQRDSVLHLKRHPIVWSDNRQINGNLIDVHLNDSTVDWLRLPANGFTAEEIEPGYYNQLSGREMFATLIDGKLDRLDVSGTVEAIMFPQEEDSTYNKIANVESSFMTAHFDNQTLKRLKMWPQTNGTVTPLYLAKKGLFFLPKFNWYADLRPTGPDDVFNVSDAMIQLLEEPEENITQKPAAQLRPMMPIEQAEQQTSGSTEAANSEAATDGIINPTDEHITEQKSQKPENDDSTNS